jgi:hypothetical protein
LSADVGSEETETTAGLPKDMSAGEALEALADLIERANDLIERAGQLTHYISLRATDDEQRPSGTSSRATPRRPGPRIGASKPVPHDAFWEIFRLMLEDGASARQIENITNNRGNPLLFVDRNKAGALRRWIDDHPTAARTALDRHQVPRGFGDTADGVTLPRRKRNKQQPPGD